MICHGMIIMPMNLNNMALLNIWDVDYQSLINGISKSEGVILLQNIDLSNKKWIIIKYNFSLLCIKDG